jgi:16S rRNA processing protein RimM
LVEVAILGKTWGVRGDITVRLHNLDSEMEWTRDQVWLEGPGLPQGAVEVADWQAKGSKVLVRFEGVDSPEDAQALVGCKVLVPAPWLGETQDGELFVRDLLGMEVTDVVKGHLGRVVDVFDAGEIDVWVVLGPQGETLVPATRDFVLEVDREARRILCRYDEG